MASARRAGLRHDLRALGLQAGEQLVVADSVVVPEVGLTVGRDVGGARIVDVGVAVPLHEREGGNSRIDRVELSEEVVAHRRICEVEHHLRLAAPTDERAPLLLQHPIGMRLHEPAAGVRHLGLHPDAELEPALRRLVGQEPESARELR